MSYEELIQLHMELLDTHPEVRVHYRHMISEYSVSVKAINVERMLDMTLPEEIRSRDRFRITFGVSVEDGELVTVFGIQFRDGRAPWNDLSGMVLAKVNKEAFYNRAALYLMRKCPAAIELIEIEKRIMGIASEGSKN